MRFKRYPYFLRVVLLLALPVFLAFVQDPATLDIAALRKLYTGPTANWPQATVDSGIVFRELGVLPNAPIQARDPQYKAMIELGKTLFFDPRLSASQQISCSSCHDPDMHWTDGRVRAIGHNHRIGMRNSPSISFAWASEKLFWDGRASSLEEQIKGSLTNKNEMNAALPEMRQSLLQIEAYQPLFQEAYADSEPSVDQLVSAVAVFMRSIRSARSSFDRFLGGDSTALSDKQIHGLHLFRTKARCINCHNGPLFTDNDFHNIGFSLYGEDKQDLGKFNVTKDPADVGKFKTASLRNVAKTGPWLHNGMFQDLRGLLNTYNRGMPRPKRKATQQDDPLFPETSVHLKPLALSTEEIDALLAFLDAISTLPYPVNRPALPGLD